MRLGIVGHAQEKFTTKTEAEARAAIVRHIGYFQPTHIVSGRSPMGGVDAYAEEVAADLGVETLIFPPRIRRWAGPGGFKERNLDIARNSDVVLVVVVRELPGGYSGMRFDGGCYHCRDRTPPHVKSGGCWTAWQARAARWEII